MSGPDHHAEMEAHYAAGMERQEEDHRREILKWLADLMCRPEEPLVGSFINSLSHAGVERLAALMNGAAQQAEADLAYHLLCQEERRLRRLLTEGPASPQECAEFCKSARDDADGKPCLDCNAERFTF